MYFIRVIAENGQTDYLAKAQTLYGRATYVAVSNIETATSWKTQKAASIHINRQNSIPPGYSKFEIVNLNQEQYEQETNRCVEQEKAKLFEEIKQDIFGESKTPRHVLGTKSERDVATLLLEIKVGDSVRCYCWNKHPKLTYHLGTVTEVKAHTFIVDNMVWREHSRLTGYDSRTTKYTLPDNDVSDQLIGERMFIEFCRSPWRSYEVNAEQQMAIARILQDCDEK